VAPAVTELTREHKSALRGILAYVEVDVRGHTGPEVVPGKIQDALDNMLSVAREAIDILNDEGMG
jgi:hypothetical protein